MKRPSRSMVFALLGVVSLAFAIGVLIVLAFSQMVRPVVPAPQVASAPLPSPPISASLSCWNTRVWMAAHDPYPSWAPPTLCASAAFLNSTYDRRDLSFAGLRFFDANGQEVAVS